MIAEYFQAFEQKDLAALKGMLHPDVTLQDPFTPLVSGRENVLAVYQGMFAKSDFKVTLRRQYEKDNGSYAAEFSLEILSKDGNEASLDGIDLIEVKDGKIVSLRAYLDCKGGA